MAPGSEPPSGAAGGPTLCGGRASRASVSSFSLLSLRATNISWLAKGLTQGRARLTAGESGGGIARIVIELEAPGDSRSMFRLRLDNVIVGEGLTAVQVHLLVGDILDRITLPRCPARDGKRDAP
jgi:hypothetical protein